MMITRILFVCSRNKLRSPTAETVFSQLNNIAVASAGIDNDADTRLSKDLIEWADIIFVMEKIHRTKIKKKFKASLNRQRIICLDIPDEYSYMQKELINLLMDRVPRHLRLP